MTERGLTTRVLEFPELHLPPWRLPCVRRGTFIFEKAVDLAHGSSALTSYVENASRLRAWLIVGPALGILSNKVSAYTSLRALPTAKGQM